MVVNNYFGVRTIDDAVNWFRGYGVAVAERYRRNDCNYGGCSEDILYKTVSGLHVYRHNYLYRDICLICAWTGTLVFFSFTFICCPKALYEKGGKWTRENGVSYWFVGSYVWFRLTLCRWVGFSCKCLCGQVQDCYVMVGTLSWLGIVLPIGNVALRVLVLGSK